MTRGLGVVVVLLAAAFLVTVAATTGQNTLGAPMSNGALGAPMSNGALSAPMSNGALSAPMSDGPATLSGPGSASAAQAGGTSFPPAYGSIFEGRASWYGPSFVGKKTASGEIYDPEGLTAAHRSLPFGTLLRVTDLDTGASVVVRVNDRGPFVADRVLDLSEAAARLIGLLPTGTALVRCEVLRPEDAAAFGKVPPVASLPSTPSPTRHFCRIQVASYSIQSNADATVERLKLSGIAATIENVGLWKRVIVASVPEEDLDDLTARLDALGYRKLLVSFGP